MLLGKVFVVIGALALVFALIAPQLGIGVSIFLGDFDKQLMIAGMLIMLGGLLLIMESRKPKKVKVEAEKVEEAEKEEEPVPAA